MKRVISVGGIFFKCKDPEAMKLWYAKHLGFEIDPYGVKIPWEQAAKINEPGYTLWTPFKESTNYFQPSSNSFMINYRVEDLEALVVLLREEGVTIVDDMETYDFGKFIHILDIEGNKIELWEPTA